MVRKTPNNPIVQKSESQHVLQKFHLSFGLVPNNFGKIRNFLPLLMPSPSISPNLFWKTFWTWIIKQNSVFQIHRALFLTNSQTCLVQFKNNLVDSYHLICFHKIFSHTSLFCQLISKLYYPAYFQLTFIWYPKDKYVRIYLLCTYVFNLGIFVDIITRKLLWHSLLIEVEM